MILAAQSAELHEQKQNTKEKIKRNDLIKYGLTMLTASTALLGAGGTAQGGGPSRC